MRGPCSFLTTQCLLGVLLAICVSCHLYREKRVKRAESYALRHPFPSFPGVSQCYCCNLLYLPACEHSWEENNSFCKTQSLPSPFQSLPPAVSPSSIVIEQDRVLFCQEGIYEMPIKLKHPIFSLFLGRLASRFCRVYTNSHDACAALF